MTDRDFLDNQNGQIINLSAWISVKDRLPETNDLVLVLANGKPRKNITLVSAYELAEYCPEGWILEMWPDWIDAKVTHWMPLPSMPKDD